MFYACVQRFDEMDEIILGGELNRALEYILLYVEKLAMSETFEICVEEEYVFHGFSRPTETNPRAPLAKPVTSPFRFRPVTVHALIMKLTMSLSIRILQIVMISCLAWDTVELAGRWQLA